MKFNTFYGNRPKPVCCVPDTETKFVDQSEADRCSLAYQLERYGMDSLQQQLEKTRAQFGYADTRLTPSFADLSMKMAEANSYFMELPAQVRKKYNHSAVEFYSQIEKAPAEMWEKGHISQKLAEDLGVKFTTDLVTDKVVVDRGQFVQPTKVVEPTVAIVPTVPTVPTVSEVSA